jgi:hypothetical protein
MKATIKAKFTIWRMKYGKPKNHKQAVRFLAYVFEYPKNNVTLHYKGQEEIKPPFILPAI